MSHCCKHFTVAWLLIVGTFGERVKFLEILHTSLISGNSIHSHHFVQDVHFSFYF